MLRTAVLSGALVLLLGCASASAPRVSSLEADRWIEIRTPLFSIVTNASEAEGVRTANQLTAFTALVENIMGIPRVKPRLPTRIYLFRTDEQFARFPVRNAAGYLIPTLRITAVGLSLERPELSSPILYHEYVHFLLRNTRRVDYPAWYEEGLAELLSSVVIRGDVAWVGGIPRHRAWALRDERRTPLETLLATRHPSVFDLEDANRFYVDAWLLVHYLHVSKGLGGPDRYPQMLRFLALKNQGRDWRSAFAESFDVGIEQLESELAAHRTRVQSRVPVLTVTLPGINRSVDVRPLSRGEAAYQLAELAPLVGEQELGEDLVRGSSPGRPGRWRSWARSRRRVVSSARRPTRSSEPWRRRPMTTMSWRSRVTCRCFG